MRYEVLQIKADSRINKIRLSKSISQQDLAAKCNFEKSNLSRMEAGRVHSTLATLNIVANALEINIVEFSNF